MPMMITYDRDGNKVPSQEFLSMVIILLRKSKVEVGMSFMHFLESFEENDPDAEVDAYDDASLRKAISKYLKENYPDDKKV